MQTVSWAQEVSAASVVAYPQLDVLFEGWCCELRKLMDGDNKEHATMGLIAALEVRSAPCCTLLTMSGTGAHGPQACSAAARSGLKLLYASGAGKPSRCCEQGGLCLRCVLLLGRGQVAKATRDGSAVPSGTPCIGI